MSAAGVPTTAPLGPAARPEKRHGPRSAVCGASVRVAAAFPRMSFELRAPVRGRMAEPAASRGASVRVASVPLRRNSA